jgi:hypothetical protein
MPLRKSGLPEGRSAPTRFYASLCVQSNGPQRRDEAHAGPHSGNSKTGKEFSKCDLV